MGHEVIHISKKTQALPWNEVIDKVNHIRVNGFSTPKSGLLLKFMDLVYTLRVKKNLPEDFDVIISNTFWSPLVLGNKAVKTCFVDVQRMPKGQMKLYKNALCLRANSNSVVEAIKQELPEKYHYKIAMIPNPLPFVPGDQINQFNKQKIILYTGRIHPEKGLDLLIKAFKNTLPDYKLQIIGPWETSMGGGGKDYLIYLRELAGSTAVEILEPVFDIETLNKYYLNASIFVYPSVAEKGETFGLAPLEAMSWGCVPVVSDLPCFRDFIKNNENGLVFDHRSSNAADALSKLIIALQNDANYRISLADKALEVRKTHSTLTIAQRFTKEFERLLSI